MQAGERTIEGVGWREASVLGLRTRVAEAGPVDASEAVVFLHGLPGSARDFERLVAEVGQFARAVAFDLPGFGKAERPRNWDYSIGTYAAVVAAMLNLLGIERAHLVMHDLGGGAGLLWAAAHPEQFRSAVIIDTGVLIGFRWHPLARMLRMPILGALLNLITTRSTFRATLRYYNPQPRKLPQWYRDQIWEDYDRATRRAARQMYRAAPASGFERLVPLFRNLDRPALVVWGRHDRAVPVAQALLQRESFPRAEIVVLDDSGHWPFIDNPDAASAAILPFLKAHVGASILG